MNFIPTTDFGGSGESIYFLHANGFPPKVYSQLLEKLTSDFHVKTPLLRPLWDDPPKGKIKTWEPFVEDIITIIENEGGNAYAAGHSIGGTVILLAAIRRPDLFSKIILLDPVLLSRKLILPWKLFSFLGLAKHIHPLVKITLNKRRTFDNTNTMFGHYRKKEIFKLLNDNSLRTFVEGSVKEGENGTVELIYSPEWEAGIYLSVMHNDFEIWRGLKDFQVSCLALVAEETDSFAKSSQIRFQKLLPKARFHVFPGMTHLFPLEQPDKVAQTMKVFLLNE